LIYEDCERLRCNQDSKRRIFQRDARDPTYESSLNMIAYLLQEIYDFLIIFSQYVPILPFIRSFFSDSGSISLSFSNGSTTEVQGDSFRGSSNKWKQI
jgi:hypothetical protein